MARFHLGCVFVLFLPALALSGEKPDLERGVAALAQGKIDLAIASFDAHVKNNPTDADGYLHRAIAYLSKDPNMAIRDFTEVIRLNPKSVNAYLGRAILYQYKGDFDSALQDYNEAVRINPADHNCFCFRGMVHHAKHDYDSAIRDYAEAIRLMRRAVDGPVAPPVVASCYSKRGMAYFVKEDYDSAIRDHTEAIRLNAAEGRYYLSRGLASEARKDFDGAIRDFTESIRLSPNEHGGYHSLARILATNSQDRLRDGKKALEYAEKSCELTNWQNPIALACLAAADAECGDFKQAVKWQNKAIELDGDDASRQERRKTLALYLEGKPKRNE